MARTASDFFANFLSRLCWNSSGVTMPVRAMSAPMTMTFATLGEPTSRARAAEGMPMAVMSSRSMGTVTRVLS